MTGTDGEPKGFPARPAWLAGWRGDAAVAAALFVLVLALFSPAVGFSFLPFDDDTFLLENAPIRGGLSAASVRWSLGFHPGYMYYPLTWLSHALDFTLFGESPAGHHAVSVALHAGSTALLFLFLSSTTSALGASALVAALFGVHPLRSESVAWVAERKDVLSVFLALLVLLAYAGWARRPSAARRAGVVALFLAGLLAKPMLVSLPFLLLLVDVWPLGRLPAGEGRLVRFGALVREKVPFFVLSALAAVGAIAGQRGGGALASLEGSPLRERAATSLYSVSWYLGKTLLPTDLSILYPFRRLEPLEVWAGGLTLALLAAVALHGRVPPAVRVGVLWYLVALLPVSGLVRTGDQLVADRYSYLPTIGLLVAAVFGVRSLLPRSDGRLSLPVAAGSVLLVGSFAMATAVDVGRFRNGLSLFTSAAEVDPDNWLAQGKVGNELVRVGRVEEAVPRYAAALRSRPGWDAAAGSLAQGLVRLGRTGEALEVLDEGLRQSPSSEWLHRVAAVLYARAGQPARAQELAARADELRVRAPARGGDPGHRKALEQLREGAGL